MKTDPKDLGNIYKKFPLKRDEAAHSRGVIIQVNECTSDKFNGRELWKEFEWLIAK